MPDLFNIWSPYPLDPYTVTFDVTQAEADIVQAGTTSFVLDCLRACGCPGEPVAWHITCVRQSYYSSYLHSSDWRARWDIAWIIEVTLASPARLRGMHDVFPGKSSVPDGTAEGIDEPPLTQGPAIVMACFPAHGSLEERIAQTVDKWKTNTGISSDVSLQLRKYSDGWLLARATCVSLKFPDAIVSLDLLQASWRREGGLTNWEDVAGL